MGKLLASKDLNEFIIQSRADEHDMKIIAKACSGLHQMTETFKRMPTNPISMMQALQSFFDYSNAIKRAAKHHVIKRDSAFSEDFFRL